MTVVRVDTIDKKRKIGVWIVITASTSPRQTQHRPSQRARTTLWILHPQAIACKQLIRDLQSRLQYTVTNVKTVKELCML